jgi:hypothetical protein|tara:strand:+ start:946 stop:2028 length:1083 start_codon:yes stop_codon:yes gene_type:complete
MAYTTITDPSAYFQTAIYNGNGGGTNNVVNDGNSNLQPDFVWVKERSSTSSHALTNSTNGAGYILSSNNTNAQSSASAFSSFNSDGFTVGSDGKTNESGQTYVGWQWKANGGTTSSNTDGTITSTVQANTTSGFSIVSYSGNGVNGATVGHGLGAQPEIIFVKRTNLNASSQGSNWPLRSTLLTAQQVMYLDLNAAAGNSTTLFNNTYPNTTTFTIGDNEATNAYQTSHSFTGTYIAYCFTSIKGFSKFGTYTGNGNAEGPFVYTGFKPAWVMYKRTDATGEWPMLDNTRNLFNVANSHLKADLSDAEVTNTSFNLDLLSNGFKIRSTNSYANANGGTYIYMAFAENPLVATNGVPTTAR